MRKRNALLAGAAAAGAVCISMAAVTPAFADQAPRQNDVVGVGSDTVEYAADFLFNGDPAGDAGFNLGKTNQVDSFFATGDGNGRALYDGYCGGSNIGTSSASGEAPCSSTNFSSNALNSTAVLRAGTLPVPRPNGSGAGLQALIDDSSTTAGSTTTDNGYSYTAGYDGLPQNTIGFVRASRLPKASEQAACAQISDCTAIHVYQFADDNLEIATAPTTNAIPMSALTLYHIYNCDYTTWSQVPGFPSGSSAASQTIYPVIPQSGSGTRNFFLADIEAAANKTTISLSCAHTAEEHDPTGITLSGSTNEPNAIEPFSVGRAELLQTNPETGAAVTNGGYFVNSGEPAAYLDIKLISGCSKAETGYNADIGACAPADEIQAADNNPVYDSNRGLYFDVRQTALSSTTALEPGGTQNFVQALFAKGGYVSEGAVASNIEEAGLDPSYSDLGDTVSSG
jgi:ABC-type phosphate transport system substrate-binding protein